MEIALEVDSVEEIASRISEYLEMRMPEGLLGKLKMLPKLAEMGAFFPKIVSNGACKEVIRRENFSLDDYPILHCWPQDGGRFITLPMVFSNNPDTGKRNCGCYRIAGVRRAHHRHALADAQARRRALPPATARKAKRSAWMSPWPSAPIQPPCIPRFFRCRPISTR